MPRLPSMAVYSAGSGLTRYALRRRRNRDETHKEETRRGRGPAKASSRQKATGKTRHVATVAFTADASEGDSRSLSRVSSERSLAYRASSCSSHGGEEDHSSVAQQCRRRHRRFLELCGRAKTRDSYSNVNTPRSVSVIAGEGDRASYASPMSTRSRRTYVASASKRKASTTSTTGRKGAESEYPTICNVAASHGRSPSLRGAAGGAGGHPTQTPASTKEVQRRACRGDGFVFGLGTYGLGDQDLLRAVRVVAAAANGPTNDAGGGSKEAAPDRRRGPGEHQSAAENGESRAAAGKRKEGRHAAGLPPIGARKQHAPHRGEANAATEETSRAVHLPPLSTSAPAAEGKRPLKRLENGGVIDIFGYFPTHRVHPECYQRLLEEQRRHRAFKDGEIRKHGFFVSNAGSLTVAGSNRKDYGGSTSPAAVSVGGATTTSFGSSRARR